MAYWNESQQESAKLLDALGTHWSSFYRDDGFVAALSKATLELEKQTRQFAEEVSGLCDRYNMPLFHTENWFALTVRQSQLARHKLVYGSGLAYGEGYSYGEQLPEATYDFALPTEELVAATAVTDGLQSPTRCWLSGIDFLIEAGYLRLRQNPFTDSAFPKTEIFENGVIVDVETTLWLFKAKFDRAYLRRTYGYLFSLPLPSTERAKQLLNAVMDATISGTVRQDVDNVISAATGVDLCKTDSEVVELVEEDRYGLVIATDKNVYRFSAAASALVTVGDVLAAGDPLVDVVQPVELNRADNSTAPLIELDRGFLPSDFAFSLLFNNQDTELVVDSAGENTTVTFEIGGFPADVELFWRAVRAREAARGYTLAQLLDRRPVPLETEPNADTLPATINPAEFLADNVLIGNVLLYVVKSNLISGGLGLDWLSVLRNIVPPWNAIVVLIVMSAPATPVLLSGEGHAAHYATNEITETSVDLAQAESAPRLRGVDCYCL